MNNGSNVLENDRRGSSDSSGNSKNRRKEDKSIEHILKALSSLETQEEKLAALCKKYTELLQENKELQNSNKQNHKRETALTHDRDRLQGEYNKAVLARSKLESLCRELQRHNKVVKDESLQRAREEEEKRKEVTAKFQTTLNEVTTQMRENQERNQRLKEENDELATRLKALVEQYEKREEQIQKFFKHKDIEQQLVDAKLTQANLQLQAEQERASSEKELMLRNATEMQKKCSILQENEGKLRAQVALYTEKYEEFQSTLTKSNEMFASFKQEMEKMTKKIKKLEKETSLWKSRWETSNQNLISMAEEKVQREKELVVLQARVKRLEALSRALQAERNASKASDEVEELLKTPPPTPAEVSQPNSTTESIAGESTSGKTDDHDVQQEAVMTERESPDGQSKMDEEATEPAVPPCTPVGSQSPDVDYQRENEGLAEENLGDHPFETEPLEGNTKLVDDDMPPLCDVDDDPNDPTESVECKEQIMENQEPEQNNESLNAEPTPDQ